MILCNQRNIFKINDLVRPLGTETLTARGTELFGGAFRGVDTSNRRRRKSEKVSEEGYTGRDTHRSNPAKFFIDTSKSETEEINEPPEPPSGKLEESPEKSSKRSYESVILPDFFIRNIMTCPLHVTREKISPDELVGEVKINKCPFPSVTTVLNETMSDLSRLALEKWKRRMIKDMGESKFTAYQEETLVRGHKFHTSLKQYLTGMPLDEVEVPKEAEGCWESVKSVLPFISNVKMVESALSHPILHYKGIVDCVASYRNVPYVIEWKQSQKVKKTISATHDAPIQLSAYMGALSWSKRMDATPNVTDGLVVVAYTNGSPAGVFPMNSDFCQTYWENWLRRLQHFWMSRSQNLKKKKKVM